MEALNTPTSAFIIALTFLMLISFYFFYLRRKEEPFDPYQAYYAYYSRYPLDVLLRWKKIHEHQTRVEKLFLKISASSRFYRERKLAALHNVMLNKEKLKAEGREEKLSVRDRELKKLSERNRFNFAQMIPFSTGS